MGCLIYMIPLDGVSMMVQRAQAIHVRYGLSMASTSVLIINIKREKYKVVCFGFCISRRSWLQENTRSGRLLWRVLEGIWTYITCTSVHLLVFHNGCFQVNNRVVDRRNFECSTAELHCHWCGVFMRIRCKKGAS